MSKYIIQTEPESLDDIKAIVKDRCGELNSITIQFAYVLQEYQELVGPLKGLDFDVVLTDMVDMRFMATPGKEHGHS